MKFITAIMLVAAWGIVVTAQILEGGSPISLVTHPSPLLLVFGGTLAVGLMGLSGSDVKNVFKALIRAMAPKISTDSVALYQQMIGFAETARRDGLLALEAAVKEVTDPFVRRALEMVIDGTDEELVADVLDSDTSALVERHKVSQAFYTALGGYAPTIGIMGTVMGMMHVLDNLDKPETMGPSIAVAFLATLWGVGSANLIWLPIATKLKRLTAVEVSYRGMVIDGVLAIQSGATPRLVGERLKAHLSPSQREQVDGDKGKKDAGTG